MLYVCEDMNCDENILHNMLVIRNFTWEKPMRKIKQGNSILPNCDLIIVEDSVSATDGGNEEATYVYSDFNFTKARICA